MFPIEHYFRNIMIAKISAWLSLVRLMLVLSLAFDLRIFYIYFI